MYPAEVVRRAKALGEMGLTAAEIAEVLDIPSSTVLTWRHRGIDASISSPHRDRAWHGDDGECPVQCAVPPRPYAYFLGQYLGDGSIVEVRRVFRCAITCCAAYPRIIDECARSMAAILPGNRVNQRAKPGAVDVSAYSKHWPCLVPQHGPGPKHLRHIELEAWQRSAVLDAHPQAFLRGLIHSDGCRSINTVTSAGGRRYSYPRYTFSNRSAQIREIFAEACDRVGIAWRPMNACTISIARQEAVAKMDRFIGPKA